MYRKIFKILKFISDYLRFSILFGVFGSYLAAGVFNIKNFISRKFSINYYFIGGLITVLSSTTTSLMNDYLDYNSDLTNPRKKNKPLVLGQVPKELNLILTALIIFFEFALIIFSRKSIFYVFFLIGIFETFGYYKLKYIPPFDLLFNAFCSVIPFYCGWVLSTNKLLPIRIIVMNILFVTIVFLHGDIWDMQYDEISTVKLIGKNKATNLTYLILILLFFMLRSSCTKYILIFFQFSFSIAYKFQSWKIYKIILIIVSLIVFLEFLIDFNGGR